jgi:hypothetical protein
MYAVDNVTSQNHSHPATQGNDVVHACVVLHNICIQQTDSWAAVEATQQPTYDRAQQHAAGHVPRGAGVCEYSIRWYWGEGRLDGSLSTTQTQHRHNTDTHG